MGWDRGVFGWDSELIFDVLLLHYYPVCKCARVFGRVRFIPVAAAGCSGATAAAPPDGSSRVDGN